MRNVYVVDGAGNTTNMEYVRCRDEEKELQILLEKNHDLLVGNQINPENPIRWVLIKREMPVPDPGSAENRWAIDFLFADNLAIPTFVECKRFLDTRSRREVVGQMMEYVANGQYYWNAKTLKEHAEETAKGGGRTLEEILFNLQPEKSDLRENFFDAVEQNLKEGQVRLIFFMEEAPMQLKSIVEFMNNQMERAEILIVEARQYQHSDLRIIVPTLFGYTEQARQLKKTVVNVPGSQTRIRRDRDSFVSELVALGQEKRTEIILDLMQMVESSPETLRGEFGTGKCATFNIKNDKNRTLCSVFVTGELQVYAVATCSNIFADIDVARQELIDGCEWKTPFQQGRYPVLVKKLEELEPEQLEKVTRFIQQLGVIANGHDGKAMTDNC